MHKPQNKTIHLAYYALLREERGIDSETVETDAETPQQLYKELQARHHFHLSENSMKVCINDQFSSWEANLKTNDTVVFIPPVSGG